MSNITVKFMGKEYSIPQDVLTYIELLDFTDSVQKQIASTFVRKLRNEIAQDNIGLLGDEDLATEIEQQVGKFIAKLCDNGIFTRTINDYLKNNKGYQLYSDVNKAALEKMKSLLIQEMDAWQAGYENAVNKVESHVTGMGFSIWSGSFVNHAIYAAMEASTLNKQGKEAEAQYQRDMSDLRSRLDSQYGGEKSNYINNTYIPNMEAALTVFAYELLDKYVADLIANGKFDGKTLDYVDISRSNDLLKNLTLSNNKKIILENAFAACPYNIAVYMQTMKYELLDFDSFQTAKVFKQHNFILSFLNENWGEVSFPTKFNINYYCIDVWASFTGKTSVELLHSLTDKYASGIVKSYSRIAEMLTNTQLCRKVMRECNEDAILADDAICKTKAYSYVSTIVSSSIWSQLTEKCGHPDLLERIKKCIPSSVDASSKEEYDKYLVEQLFSVFSTERRVLVAEIEKQRKAEAERKAEQEKQELERKKRNKKITAIVIPIIAVAIVFVVVLNSVIIPNKNYNVAVKLMNDGKYEEAIASFETMDGYKDSSQKIEECYTAIFDTKYDVAISLMNDGQYNDAISAFEELQGHLDSEDKIEECRTAIKDLQYTQAIALMNNGKYKEAISSFESLNGYKDSSAMIATCRDNISAQKYLAAEKLLSDGKYYDAAIAFCNLSGYEDSWQRSFDVWSLITKQDTIAAYENTSVAVKTDGTVVATGANWHGELNVKNWTDIISVSIGDQHTVGLTSDGRVVATGEDFGGRCDVSWWRNVVAVSAGTAHTVGLQMDGTVVATGENFEDQCEVSDWTDIIAIETGEEYTIGLKSNGTVVIAGSVYDSQKINNWRNITAISAGSTMIIGLKSDGSVVVAGVSYSVDEYAEQMADWSNIIAVSTERIQAIGLKSDGTVLRAGKTVYNYGSYDMSSWRNVVAICTSESHTLGLKSDGTVIAIGDKEHGQCDVSNWSNIKIPN